MDQSWSNMFQEPDVISDVSNSQAKLSWQLKGIGHKCSWLWPYFDDIMRIVISTVALVTPRITYADQAPPVLELDTNYHPLSHFIYQMSHQVRQRESDMRRVSQWTGSLTQCLRTFATIGICIWYYNLWPDTPCQNSTIRWLRIYVCLLCM